jgi:multidrug efflux pump subunit AcrB
LPKRFPGVEFFFQPADIVTQILNFGLPAAIDVQFAGANMAANAVLAAELVKSIRKIPGAVDAHVHQRFDSPVVNLQMDRTRLQQMGLSAFNVGQNVLVLAVGQLADRAGVLAQSAERRGLQHRGADAAVQGRHARRAAQHAGQPHRRRAAAAASTGTQLLGNLVEATPNRQLAVVSRYNIMPVVDVYVSVQGTDLASVAGQVQKAGRRDPPEVAARQHGRAARPGPDDAVVVHRPRRRSRDGDRAGLPADRRQLPVVDRCGDHHRGAAAALAGIAWMLFITGTTLSVPALTGAIMTMGVATANSILVIAFARQRQQEGVPALSAALEAGATRFARC